MFISDMVMGTMYNGKESPEEQRLIDKLPTFHSSSKKLWLQRKGPNTPFNTIHGMKAGNKTHKTTNYPFPSWHFRRY